MYAIRSYYDLQKEDLCCRGFFLRKLLFSKLGSIINIFPPLLHCFLITDSSSLFQSQLPSIIRILSCEISCVYGIWLRERYSDILFPFPTRRHISRITSYNVCYTKLLRFTESLKRLSIFSSVTRKCRSPSPLATNS